MIPAFARDVGEGNATGRVSAGAKQGDQMARFEMADANSAALGEGVPSADMFYQLGIQYSVGHDVPADLVAAHKWFNIAAMKGNSEAIRQRQEIAECMSPAEIAAAQRAARAWLTAH
jgi:TPR repeat protein